MSLAVKMVRRLVAEGGLRGFHFCTLNLEKSVERILENLGWTPRHAKVQNKLIAVSIHDNESKTDVRNNLKESPGSAEPSTPTNTELIVTPANATSSATTGLAAHVPKDGDTGKGEANNAATWDEFPNGRFGDVNSPAFGSQDLWGGYGRIVSAIFIHAPYFTTTAHNGRIAAADRFQSEYA